VFVIDTSHHNDQQSFSSSHNFIKDIIGRMADYIRPDALHLGVIYNTESDEQQLGLIGFQNTSDATATIGTAWSGLKCQKIGFNYIPIYVATEHQHCAV